MGTIRKPDRGQNMRNTGIDELSKVANAEHEVVNAISQQDLLMKRAKGLAGFGSAIDMGEYVAFFKALLRHMQTHLTKAIDSVLADFETIVLAFASSILNNLHSNPKLTYSEKLALRFLSTAIMVVKKTEKKEKILEYTRIFLAWEENYLSPNQKFLELKTASASEAPKPSNIAKTTQEAKNIMRKKNDDKAENLASAPLSLVEVKTYLTDVANEFYQQHQGTEEIQPKKGKNFEFNNIFYYAAITKPNEKFDDENKRFMPKFVIIIRPPQNIYAHGEQLYQYLQKIFIKPSTKATPKSRIIFKSTNPKDLEKDSKFSMRYGTKELKRSINLSDYPEGTIAIYGTHLVAFLNEFYGRKPDLKHEKALSFVLAEAPIDNAAEDQQKTGAVPGSLPSESSSLDLFAQDVHDHGELFNDIPELAAIEKQIEIERQRREGLTAELDTAKQEYIEQRKQHLLEKLEQERRATQETEAQLGRMRGLSLSISRPKSPNTPSLFSPAPSPQLTHASGKKREAEEALLNEGKLKKQAP
jgi:hypothetical protein